MKDFDFVFLPRIFYMVSPDIKRFWDEGNGDLIEIWKHTFSYVPNFVIFGRIFRLSPEFVHFFTKLNIKFINMPSGVCNHCFV